MEVGTRVKVVKADGYLMEAWVKVGMEGEVVRVYPRGDYRYHVKFESGQGEDFDSEEIRPIP